MAGGSLFRRTGNEVNNILVYFPPFGGRVAAQEGKALAQVKSVDGSVVHFIGKEVHFSYATAGGFFEKDMHQGPASALTLLARYNGERHQGAAVLFRGNLFRQRKCPEKTITGGGFF